MATVAALLVDISLSPLSCTAAEVGNSRLSYWRHAEADGVNCVFWQVSLLGYSKPFRQYMEDVQLHEQIFPNDFKSLSQLARQLGFDVATARLTMKDLEGATIPMVVHLEETDVKSGYFALVVSVTEKEVILVNGTTASRDGMSRDSFRRQWNGYALVPQRPANWLARGGRACAAVVLLLLLRHLLPSRLTFKWRPHQY